MGSFSKLKNNGEKRDIEASHIYELSRSVRCKLPEVMNHLIHFFSTKKRFGPIEARRPPSDALRKAFW
jgi:hypothetical protein